MNPLFRQQALAKVTNPDQLEQALRVSRDIFWAFR